ncbi:MAG: cadherin-like beta sandwich domain-containing protein [Syntrophomonas sp.]
MQQFVQEQNWIQQTARIMDEVQEASLPPAPQATLTYQETPAGTLAPATANTPGLSPGTILQNQTALETVNRAIEESTGNAHSTNTPSSTTNTPTTSTGGGGGGGGGGDSSATIRSVSDLMDTVVEGDPYQLPVSVTATMSNGTTRQVPVNWSSGNPDTAVAGIVQISGTVTGYASPVRLILAVGKRFGVPAAITAGQPVIIEGGISIDLGTMSIPEGATVTVQEVTAPDFGTSGMQAAGKIIDINFSNIVIDQPVQISLPLNPGVDPNKSAIYLYDNGNWEYQPSQFLNGSIVATVTHFSIYGVLLDQSPPENVNVSKGNVSSGSVELLLSARDSSGEIEYQIYRDGELLATTTDTSYVDQGLESGNEYHYQVKAIDRFDNISDFSPTLDVTVIGNNTDLSGLSISPGTISPVFAKDNLSYTASVSCEVESVTVTATAADEKSSLTINGSEVSPGENGSATINLEKGENVITIIVKAEDETSTKTYTLVITRASNNYADLSGLSINPGTINPVFEKDTLNYTASVSREVESIAITAISTDEKASVTINGSPAAGGDSTIDLEKGENTITIIVNAEDGVTSRTYTLVITRAGSDNADLAGITISSGTISPVFDKDVLNYTSSAGKEVEQITLSWTLAEPAASVKVNGSSAGGTTSMPITLNTGENIVTIEVTAEDGTTIKSYTLTVNKSAKNNNAYLSSLSTSAGGYSPGFSKEQANYSSTVPYYIGSISINAVPEDSLATVSINGNPGTSSTVNLNEGANSLNIRITAEDGSTTRDYSLTVTREAAPPPPPPVATADVVFALTTPAAGDGNSISGGGATRTVVVSVVNNTSPVVITGTKTAAQTVTIGGTDAALVAAGGTDTAPTYEVNTDIIKAAGGGKTFSLTISESGKTNIVYTVTVNVQALTADVAFDLTDPEKDSSNTISGGGATKTITINVENNTKFVTLTGMKTTTQTIAIGGINAAAVTASGTGTAPTYIVDTENIAAVGGSKTFTLTVSEIGKTSIVYTVNVAVSAPLQTTGDVAFALTTPAPGGGNSISGGGATRTVAVSAVNNTGSVIIPGTKTAAQTVTIGGTDAALAVADGTNTAPTYEVNTDSIKAAGGSKTFTLTISETGKTSIVYAITVTVAAVSQQATGDVAFALTTPTVGDGNSISGGGATRTVSVSVVNNTDAVVITGTKTAAQTVAFGGTDAALVAANGTDTDPTYEVNTDSIKADGGSKTFTLTIDEAGKTSIVYTVTIIVAAPTSGNIDGYICHAVDNSHVSGIIISFRPGSNNTSGTPVATVTTDSNGYYKVEGLAAGTYTGQTSGTGFSSTTLTVTCVANTTTTAPICVITPILPDGVTRIVLTWGSSPQDMDSYLSGPSATGRFKVFYRKKNHQYLNKTYVELDRDDRDGYGPETTTIYQQLNGDYILSVNRYSNDGDIYSSGAQVKVYRGSDVVATFDAPTDVNTGKWWTVFKMNGNTITPINYISNSFEATSTTNENQNYSIALESFSKDKM